MGQVALLPLVGGVLLPLVGSRLGLVYPAIDLSDALWTDSVFPMILVNCFVLIGGLCRPNPPCTPWYYGLLGRAAIALPFLAMLLCFISGMVALSGMGERGPGAKSYEALRADVAFVPYAAALLMCALIGIASASASARACGVEGVETGFPFFEAAISIVLYCYCILLVLAEAA